MGNQLSNALIKSRGLEHLEQDPPEPPPPPRPTATSATIRKKIPTPSLKKTPTMSSLSTFTFQHPTGLHRPLSPAYRTKQPRRPRHRAPLSEKLVCLLTNHFQQNNILPNFLRRECFFPLSVPNQMIPHGLQCKVYRCSIPLTAAEMQNLDLAYLARFGIQSIDVEVETCKIITPRIRLPLTADHVATYSLKASISCILPNGHPGPRCPPISLKWETSFQPWPPERRTGLTVHDFVTAAGILRLLRRTAKHQFNRFGESRSLQQMEAMNEEMEHLFPEYPQGIVNGWSM